MSEFAALAKTLSGDVVAEVKGAMKEDYDALTDLQKATILATAEKVIELRLRAKAGEDVEAKLQAVESSVQDWKVWGSIGADTAFWKGVQVVAQTLGSFLAGVGRGLIPGL